MSDLPESSKSRGHLAELLFAVEAKKRGHTVLTPGGDNAPFDVVIYNERGQFFRVQVKSCLGKEPGRTRKNWTVKKGGKNQKSAYHKEDADVIALYAFDDNSWHLLPIDVLGEDTQIKIDQSSKYAIFCEGWEIFN